MLLALAGVLVPSMAQADPAILSGSYIKIGLNDKGTLGYGANTSPGILYDGTGTGTFNPSYDYLTPGSPFEGFTISGSAGSAFSATNNNAYLGSAAIGGTLTLYNNVAYNGETYDNRAVWVGSYNSLFTVTNEYFFNNSDQQLSIRTTIGATVDLTDLTFSRFTDPDARAATGDRSATNNFRGNGAVAATDLVYAEAVASKYVIGLYTNDPITHNSAVTDWSQDTASYISGTNVGNGDNTIGLGFSIGNLTAGSSITLDYKYIFGTDISKAIDANEGGGTPDITGTSTTDDLTAGRINPAFAGGTLEVSSAGSFAQNFTISSAGATIDTQGHDALFSGVFSNATGSSGSLTKVGEGTLTLTGANSYSGGTTISGGTLVGNSSSLGGLIVNNAVLVFDQGSDDSFAGSISGTGNFVKQGSGVLTLTGANSYTGTTTIASGTLKLGNSNALGSNAGVVIEADATFDSSTFDTVIDSVLLKGGALAGLGTMEAATVEIEGGVIGLNLIGGSFHQKSGTTILNGDSSMSTMKVSGGSLTLNGRASGAITIEGGKLIAGVDDRLNVNSTLNLVGGALELAGTIQSIGGLSGAAGSAIDLGTGKLTVVQSGDASFGGVISGSGSLVKQGSGTLTLTGVNSYTGGTTISGGTLATGDDNVLSASGGVNVGNGATLAIGSTSQTVGGFVLDGGTLSGTGTLTAASYTLKGGTVDANIGGGALVQASGTTVLNGQTAGTITISGGSLVTGADDRLSVNSTVSLAGGSLVLGGTNQSIGGLSGAAGSAIDLGTGKLTVVQSGDASFGGVISGSGSLVKQGSGTLTLTGVNSYTGGTTISGGTLVGDATSLRGPIVNDARLVFDQANDGQFDGVISGSGVVVKEGAGLLTLNGVNSYSGGTVINGGTVVAGNAQALGTGSVTFSGGTLRFAYSGVLDRPTLIEEGVLTVDSGSNNVEIGAPYSGDGGLTKVGSGTLDLTGEHSLTGATTVLEGRLKVNGSLAGSTATVQGGASIGGNGTVGGLIVKTNAMAAPGNSIGRLSVATFALFEAGSIYEVEVDAAGNTDRVAVTGNATLEGGTVRVLAEAGNYRPRTAYTILTADGGVTGQFEDVTTNFAYLTPQLAYGANAVTLTLTRNDLSLAAPAQSFNQRGAASAADPVFRLGSPIYEALLESSVAEARDAFDQLSGEAHASAVSVAVADAQVVRDAILGRTRQGFATEGSSALWGQALGSWSDTQGNGNAAPLERSTEGWLIGFESALGDHVRVGIVGGATQAKFDVDARGSSGSVDAVQAAVYGSASLGKLQLRAGLGYAWLDVDVTRSVSFGGFNDQLKSGYDGSTVQSFGEAGYRMDFGKLALEPFAGLTALWVTTDAFAERGGSAALNLYGRDRDIAFSTLGLRAEAKLGERTPVALRALAGWRRAFNEVEPTAMASYRAGGEAFTLSGAPIDRNSLVLDAGLDWRIGQGVVLGASYAGSIGKRTEEHGVKGSLTFSF